jgi:hypothetical protein
MDIEEEERIEAVNRYIKGDKPSNICGDAGRSEKWLFNWVNRFKTGEEEWYKSRSRAPKKHGRKMTTKYFCAPTEVGEKCRAYDDNSPFVEPIDNWICPEGYVLQLTSILGGSNTCVKTSVTPPSVPIEPPEEGGLLDHTLCLLRGGQWINNACVFDTRGDGKIVALDTAVEGDEVSCAVKIRNDGIKTEEYRVRLYLDNVFVNEEPDTYWANIKGGNTEQLLVSTKWKNYDISGKLGGKIELVEQEYGVIDSKTFSLGVSGIWEWIKENITKVLVGAIGIVLVLFAIAVPIPKRK